MAAHIKFNGHEIEVQDGCEVVVEGERLIIRPTPQPPPFVGSISYTPTNPAWNPTWIGPTIAPTPIAPPFTITCGDAVSLFADSQASPAK